MRDKGHRRGKLSPFHISPTGVGLVRVACSYHSRVLLSSPTAVGRTLPDVNKPKGGNVGKLGGPG